MGVRRTIAFGLLSSFALLGCTALLGSFEVNDSVSGVSEGGGGEGGDDALAESPREAASDAPVDAASLLLKCAANLGNIRKIDTARPPPVGGGGGGQLGFDEPKVFRISDSAVRIVTRPSHTSGFAVYDFNPRGGGTAPAMLNVELGSRVFAAHQYPGWIGVLGVSGGGSSVPGRLDIHRIADTSLVDQIIPLTAAGTVSGFGTSGMRGPAGDFLVLGSPTAPEFFYTYSSGISASGPFSLHVGRTTSSSMTGPNAIYTSTDVTDQAISRALIHSAQRVFIPLEQDSNGPPTKTDGIVDTSDDGKGGAATKRSMGAPGGKPSIFVSSGPAKGPSNAVNMAFVDIDIASTSAPITYRLGAVPAAKLSTFTTADVPVAFSIDSISRFAADGGDGGWTGDDFVMIGRGPAGTPGLNFFWYEAGTRTMRANQTGPDALLKDRPNVVQASLAFASAPLPIYTSFDLVWTETVTVDGSATQDLYYAEITCVR